MNLQFNYATGCPNRRLARPTLGKAHEELRIDIFVEENPDHSNKQVNKIGKSGPPGIWVYGRDVLLGNSSNGISRRAYLFFSHESQARSDFEQIRQALDVAERHAGCCQ